MKKILSILAVLLLSCTYAFADDTKSAAQADPYHDWMTYYYLSNDSAKVPDFLKWLQESGLLEKSPDASFPVEGFLSVVFASNPDKAKEWLHSDTFTGKTKAALDYASEPPLAPDNKEIKNQDDLAMVWASYYASGKDIYLNKIINVLDKKTELKGDAAQDDATRAAAAISLGSNMTQHEAVNRFLSEESGKRSGDVGEELKSIVAKVTEQRNARAFPHSDGEFSATMFVTDPKVAAKEFAAAPGSVLHFKEMSRARKGDTRTIVIVFAGMQLTPDYLADVTYDVQLHDPNGKLYKDLKDLTGVQQKLPTRFRIFHNQAAIFVTFGPKDTQGTYKVDVTLKDNVGKKSIPLTSKIVFRK